MQHPPDRDALQALHERLLRGDRLASEELFRVLLPVLQDEMARRFRGTDENLVSDGVIDALLDYSAHPEQVDAAKGTPLDQVLATAAWRNVANFLKGERRRKQRERKVGGKKSEADVALDPVARNIQQEHLQELEERQAALLNALDDVTDKEILTLRLQGVRDTAAFARVLGITDLPLQQQRKEVKRRKDRIIRFLRRKGLLP